MHASRKWPKILFYPQVGVIHGEKMQAKTVSKNQERTSFDVFKAIRKGHPKRDQTSPISLNTSKLLGLPFRWYHWKKSQNVEKKMNKSKKTWPPPAPPLRSLRSPYELLSSSSAPTSVASRPANPSRAAAIALTCPWSWGWAKDCGRASEQQWMGRNLWEQKIWKVFLRELFKRFFAVESSFEDVVFGTVVFSSVKCIASDGSLLKIRR